MDAFKASDMFEVAIQIEDNGEKFYRHAASLTDDNRMKDVFEFVADEEVKHKKVFQGLAEKLEDDYAPPESYPGEYCNYVRAYATNLVFPAEELQKQLSNVKSTEDAVEFAIQREIESILYYLEMKNFIPTAHKEEVDRIIDEERKHYLRLSDLKRGMD